MLNEVLQSLSAIKQYCFLYRSQGIFPTKEHLDMLVDGKPYSDIPVVHITCTYNNTLIRLQDGGMLSSDRGWNCIWNYNVKSLILSIH